METRYISPTHLLMKIESFSKLWKHEIEPLESSEFESGDYKWKVRIILDKDDYISVNLCMVGTSSLLAGSEVNAISNFFLYNHISDNYLCFRGKVRRFHAINLETRFSKLINKKTLTEVSNGYLFNNKCVFGVEVYVMKKQAPLIQNVCVHKYNASNPYKHKWKISKFSKLEGIWKSEDFSVGGYKWNIQMYPNGSVNACGRYVSIYLYCVDAESFGSGKKLNATCIFTFKSKSMLNGIKDHSMKVNHWFTSHNLNRGFAEFKAIGEMRDPTKGLVVDDCCTLEIQLSVVALQEEAHRLE